MYDAFFDRVLTRTDAERAHHAAFRAIRAARPVTGAGAAQRRRGPVERDGADLPARASAWPRASTRTPSASTRSPPSASGTSRSAPSPASRSPATRPRGCSGCRPTARSSTGWASTTTAPSSWRPAAARAPTGARPARPPGRRRRRQHRQDQGGARGRPGGRPGRLREERAACWRRTPTTSWSTSPRRTPRAAQPPVGRPARAPCSRPYAGAPTTSATRACRCWSRSRPTSTTPTCWRSRTWPARSASTGSSPPTPPSAAPGWSPTRPRSSGSARAGSPAAPSRARSLEVLRLLRKAVGDDLTLVSVGGISTAADARERLDAGAALVQAYTGFVYGGPLWPRRVVRGLSSVSTAPDGEPATAGAVARHRRRCSPAGRSAPSTT